MSSLRSTSGGMYRDGGSGGSGNAVVTASMRAWVDASSACRGWRDSEIGVCGDGSSHGSKSLNLCLWWKGYGSLRPDGNPSPNSNVSGGGGVLTLSGCESAVALESLLVRIMCLFEHEAHAHPSPKEWPGVLWILWALVAFDLLRDALSAIFGLSELKEISSKGAMGGDTLVIYFWKSAKVVMSVDSAITYTSVHSEARSWSIPSENPYEEAARQLLEQAPHSPEYIPVPWCGGSLYLVYIPEPEL
ncbi:hypothetical protein Tco_0386891 [Tanacetum coccineum]